MRFKQHKKSNAQKVGEVVGGALSAALPKKQKKTYKLRTAVGIGSVLTGAAIIAGAIIKPKPEDRQ